MPNESFLTEIDVLIIGQNEKPLILAKLLESKTKLNSILINSSNEYAKTILADNNTNFGFSFLNTKIQTGSPALSFNMKDVLDIFPSDISFKQINEPVYSIFAEKTRMYIPKECTAMIDRYISDFPEETKALNEFLCDISIVSSYFLSRGGYNVQSESHLNKEVRDSALDKLCNMSVFDYFNKKIKNIRLKNILMFLCYKHFGCGPKYVFFGAYVSCLEMESQEFDIETYFKNAINKISNFISDYRSRIEYSCIVTSIVREQNGKYRVNLQNTTTNKEGSVLCKYIVSTLPTIETYEMLSSNVLIKKAEVITKAKATVTNDHFTYAVVLALSKDVDISDDIILVNNNSYQSYNNIINAIGVKAITLSKVKVYNNVYSPDVYIKVYLHGNLGKLSKTISVVKESLETNNFILSLISFLNLYYPEISSSTFKYESMLLKEDIDERDLMLHNRKIKFLPPDESMFTVLSPSPWKQFETDIVQVPKKLVNIHDEVYGLDCVNGNNNCIQLAAKNHHFSQISDNFYVCNHDTCLPNVSGTLHSLNILTEHLKNDAIKKSSKK